MEQLLLPEGSPSPHASKLALRFTHFRDDRIQALLYDVCELVGHHGDLAVVLDHLMDLYRSSKTQRKELLLVFKHVIQGARGKASEEVCPLIEGMAVELVEQAGSQSSPEAWSGESQTDQKVCQPIIPFTCMHCRFFSLQDSALLSCLILDVLVVAAEVLGRGFAPLLQQLAYPLMHWLGDGDSSVASFARGAVDSIAHSCGYRI